MIGNIDLGIVVVILFVSLICLTLFYSVYISAYEWSTLAWLRRKGSVTDGMITNKFQKNGGRTARLLISYSYNVNLGSNYDRTFAGEQQVSWKHYQNLTLGTPIKVSYLSTNPKISRLAGTDSDNTFRDGTTIVATITMLIMPPLLLLWMLVFILRPIVTPKQP
jgi:hypothetical protein